MTEPDQDITFTDINWAVSLSDLVDLKFDNGDGTVMAIIGLHPEQAVLLGDALIRNGKNLALQQHKESEADDGDNG